MTVEYPVWWPPKVGDKLRHFTHHGSGGNRIVQVHALVHVVAVFEHDGDTLATVAEWFPTRRRWNYSTIRGWSEGMISHWPDGDQPPSSHQPCNACRADGEPR